VINTIIHPEGRNVNRKEKKMRLRKKMWYTIKEERFLESSRRKNRWQQKS